MTFINTIISLLFEEVFHSSEFILCPICTKKLNYDCSECEQTVFCKKCELGITLPPPSIAASTDAISEVQYNKYREDKRSQWINKAVKRLDWLHLWVPEGTILEIGSGFGEFLEVATNTGHDCFGIESSSIGQTKTRKLCNAIVFNSFNEWELNSNNLRVDAITAWHSIQYMKNPINSLKRAHNIVRKDGYLFAEIINFSPNRDKNKMHIQEYTKPLKPLKHCHYHSKKSIEKLFVLSGFEIIHYLETTSRIYLNHITGKRWRNESLIQGDLFPDNDLLRIVAKKI